jgi:hypothetical protein
LKGTGTSSIVSPDDVSQMDKAALRRYAGLVPGKAVNPNGSGSSS